jgi:hypothetical protein
MKKLSLFGVALAIAANAFAAPNVTNVTQKGSLLIWPDIRVDNDGDFIQGVATPVNTLIRIQNDGSQDVDVKCYWMDGNKNRVDFTIPLTRNQPAWIDARTGAGTFFVNAFPFTNANGFDNPFLLGPFANQIPSPTAAAALENLDNAGPYRRGLLACWAVDNGGQNQVKWNHLSGTATVYNAFLGAYEYNAYAFFVPTGLDLEPVGVAGTLNLNGVEYDSCPQYMIGQFTPVDVAVPSDGGVPPVDFQLPNTSGPLWVWGNRLAVAGCTLNLNQDWQPVWTKLEFIVWNEDEIPFTGAYECSDSWHETAFADIDGFGVDNTGVIGDIPAIDARADIQRLAGGWIDSAAQNFQWANLGTYTARYRIQGKKSTQCEATGRVTQAVGVIAVQSSSVSVPGAPIPSDLVGTTLAAAGKFTGKIVWDPAGAVPEGRIK